MRPEDLARIAFVTKRFGDLQGLQAASFGSALVIYVVIWTLRPDRFQDPFPHIVLPAQLTMFALSNGIDGYYRRSFGRAPSGDRQARLSGSRAPWSQACLFPWVVILGMGADMFKGFESPGGVSFGAAALAAYCLWILVRDWPHRLHHIIGAATGIAATLISSAIPVVPQRFGGATDPMVASHYALIYGLVGLAILAVGLLDHRMLSRALSISADPADAASAPPDLFAARLRTAFSGTCLVVILGYIGIAGWPTQVFGIYTGIYIGIGALMIAGAARDMVSGLAEHQVAYSELTRAREARLLAKIAAMRRESQNVEIDPPTPPTRVPRFDLIGHLALPLMMACGAMVDVAVLGWGLPSFLALALAASHLRIAVRDWPSRWYYLLGSLAASVSAVHFTFIGQHQALDWMLWFLILICGAMVVEGLLDYRLANSTALDSRQRAHADAI